MNITDRSLIRETINKLEERKKITIYLAKFLDTSSNRAKEKMAMEVIKKTISNYICKLIENDVNNEIRIDEYNAEIKKEIQELKTLVEGKLNYNDTDGNVSDTTLKKNQTLKDENLNLKKQLDRLKKENDNVVIELEQEKQKNRSLEDNLKQYESIKAIISPLVSESLVKELPANTMDTDPDETVKDEEYEQEQKQEQEEGSSILDDPDSAY